MEKMTGIFASNTKFTGIFIAIGCAVLERNLALDADAC